MSEPNRPSPISQLAANVRGGRLYTRTDLEARIERFRVVFESPAHRDGVTSALRAVLGDLLPMIYSVPTDSAEAQANPTTASER